MCARAIRTLSSLIKAVATPLISMWSKFKPTDWSKLRSASRRPCEISGWYGVYAVYQAGFCRMFRVTTGGVYVP